MSDYTIHHGDALDVLRCLERESVDAVITDPPYGETSLEWDRRAEWLSLIRPLLKPSGSVWFFTSLKHLLAMDLREWNVAQEIVWEKHNGSNFHADRFRLVHEFAVQIYPVGVPWAGVYKSVVTTPDATKRQVRRKKRPTHTGHIDAGYYESQDGGPRLARSVMRVRSCHGYAEHPTQKPLGIIAPMVEYSCPPGGLVLDPFMGSGSVGVVCRGSSRQFLGVEKRAQYFAIAKRRMSEVQMSLI